MALAPAVRVTTSLPAPMALPSTAGSSPCNESPNGARAGAAWFTALVPDLNRMNRRFKMDINDIILSDAALEVIDNGEWMEVDEAPGLELLVTGMQADSARKAIKALQAKVRAQSRGKALTEEQYSNITKEVLIEHVLKGWRGLKNNGEDLPYSKDLARKFIMSRGGERFTMMVLNAAQRLDDNANAFVEQVGKPSPPASDGQ